MVILKNRLTLLMLNVILIMMIILMPVKSINVSSILKMNGEMLTVQVTVMPTVLVHSTLQLNVQILGVVKILLISFFKL